MKKQGQLRSFLNNGNRPPNTMATDLKITTTSPRSPSPVQTQPVTHMIVISANLPPFKVPLSSRLVSDKSIVNTPTLFAAQNEQIPQTAVQRLEKNLSALQHESKVSSLSENDEIQEACEFDINNVRHNILMKHHAPPLNSRVNSQIQNSQNYVNFSPKASALDIKNGRGRKQSETIQRNETAEITQTNFSGLKDSQDSGSVQDHVNPLISHKPILAKYANRFINTLGSTLPNLKDIEQKGNLACCSIVSPRAFGTIHASTSNQLDINYLQVQNAIPNNFIPKGSPPPNKKLSKFTVKDTPDHVMSHNLLPEHHTISGGYQAIRNQILDNISLRTAEFLQVQSQIRKNTNPSHKILPTSAESIEQMQTATDTAQLQSKIQIQGPILQKNYRQQKQYKNLQQFTAGDMQIEQATQMSKSIWKQVDRDPSDLLSQDSEGHKVDLFSPNTSQEFKKDFLQRINIRENNTSSQSTAPFNQSQSYREIRQNHLRRLTSEIQEIGHLNSYLINRNQQNLGGILAKEVNKKNFTIFKTSTSGEDLFVGTSQNNVMRTNPSTYVSLQPISHKVSRLQFPLKSIKDFQSQSRIIKPKVEAESPDKTFMTFLNHQSQVKMSNIRLNTVTSDPDPSMNMQPQLSIDVGSVRTGNTSQELQQRYKKKHVINIFCEGENLAKDDCACYKFELNSLINRYYVYQEGSSKHKDQIEDKEIQARIYVQALHELVEKVSDILRPQNSTLPIVKQKRFNKLYTIDGEQIKSLLDIPADCKCLVACCNFFVQLQTGKLNETSETVDDFAKRLIQQSNIQVDPNPGFNTVTYKPSDQAVAMRATLKQKLMGNLMSRPVKAKQVSNSEVKLPAIQERKLSLLQAFSCSTPDHKDPKKNQNQENKSSKISLEQVISPREMKEAINEKEIFVALAQRKKWKENYQLQDFQIFELFSEFTSLMLIARQKRVEKHPDSVQAKFNKAQESKDYLADILPFQSGCLKTYSQDKKAQIVKQFKMTQEDLADFRVPLNVFIQSSLVFLRTKPDLRLKILNALGIDIKNPAQRVDWETYLLLNKLLRYSKASNDELIEFYCKFFDPNNNGIATDQEFEALIELLFGSGDEPIPDQDKKGKNESVTDNLRYICQKNGVYSENGLVDFDQLRLAFKEGHLDIEIFKQALK